MLSILLPSRCAVCARPGPGLCAWCAGLLVRLRGPGCARCGCPGPWPVRRCVECAGRRLGFATARAALVYDERARLLVRAWKEQGRRDLARVVAGIVAAVVVPPPADAIAFVPSDGDRRLRRGHAPPERLARELARAWGRPVAPLLARAGPRPRQRGLGPAERRRNVAGAFAAVAPAPPAVCLVDDVYTTGATVNACATALRRAGAARVDVVCLARAVR